MQALFVSLPKTGCRWNSDCPSESRADAGTRHGFARSRDRDAEWRIRSQRFRKDLPHIQHLADRIAAERKRPQPLGKRIDDIDPGAELALKEHDPCGNGYRKPVDRTPASQRLGSGIEQSIGEL